MQIGNAANWARAAGGEGRIPMTPPTMPDPNASTMAGLGPLRPVNKPPAAGLNEGAKPAWPVGGLMGMFMDQMMGQKSSQPFNLNTWFADKMKQQQATAPAAPTAPAAAPNKYDRASTLLGIGADLLG
jgi:hypothetical protein